MGEINMPRIFLIRHGETLWNKETRYQGQLDIPLSKEGEQQAWKLANVFREEKIEAIYSSDLTRAINTAKIINKFHNKKVAITPLLRELCFGKWEGKTYEELMKEEKDEYTKWLDNPFCLQPPGGESLSELINRVDYILSEMARSHKGNKNILVVTHGGPIKAVISAILGINTEAFFKIKIGNASITEIVVEEDGDIKKNAFIVKINDTCHLK